MTAHADRFGFVLFSLVLSEILHWSNRVFGDGSGVVNNGSLFSMG